jgi:D-alanyl-D-alanine carboxypeptidase (penicillin-binding protein 5/6)
MGAEIVPARAWQQGVTLLDWGFGVPASAGVGHLVTPDEASRLHNPPSASATSAGAAQATVRAAPPPVVVSSRALTMIGLLGVPLLAIALVGPLLIRRALRRRAVAGGPATRRSREW